MLLTQFEDRLSNVPRWGIVRTIQKQTVDQHSFRVAIIAARLVDQWAVPPRELQATQFWRDLHRYALLHDQFEAFTGDIPSPLGRYVDKDRVHQDFEVKVHEIPEPSDTVKAIVKAADLIEAMMFLKVEQAMGNMAVYDIYNDIKRNLRDHLGNHCRDFIMYSVERDVQRMEDQQDPLRSEQDLLRAKEEEIPF